MAQSNGELASISKRISGHEYPHILGAKLSIGESPETLLIALKDSHNANKPVDIRSATKSITALLFGVSEAFDTESLLRTPVSLFLPQYFSSSSIAVDVQKTSITVHDLLTMRSGLACNDWVSASVGHEDKMYQSHDWIGFWSSKPVAFEPGEHFNYCTGNVIALGEIITSQTEMPVPVFADKYLFSKMGIEDIHWETTPKGRTDTGGHLKMRLSDLHKIGLLVLNKGRWHGKQIVSEKWIAKITAVQTPVPERREQYGMLWWSMYVPNGTDTVHMIYAHGNGGNFIIIIPEIALVATFIGNAFNSIEQFAPLKLLVNEILPQLSKR